MVDLIVCVSGIMVGWWFCYFPLVFLRCRARRPFSGILMDLVFEPKRWNFHRPAFTSTVHVHVEEETCIARGLRERLGWVVSSRVDSRKIRIKKQDGVGWPALSQSSYVGLCQSPLIEGQRSYVWLCQSPLMEEQHLKNKKQQPVNYITKTY